MTAPGYVPDDAEDITDHGASANPFDPGLDQARRNLQAIQDAASAAGAGGAIYVPDGTFYVGTNDVPNWTAFGNREPRGISIYGAGPEDSIVGVTEHADRDQNHNVFRWFDGQDHGTVTIRGFQLYGNGDNLPDLYSGNSGSNAFILDGSGTVAASELYIRRTYDAGIWCKNDGGTIERCTFEHIAIQRENDAYAGGDRRIDHATKAHHTAGEWLEFDRCKFQTISGNCTNQDSGNVRVTRSYAKGYGTQWNKLSQGRFEMSNTYIRANTPDQEEAVAFDDPDGFIGRYGPFRKFDGPGEVPTVELNHVEIHDTTGAAILVTEGPEGSADAVLQNSDVVAIHNAAFKEGARSNRAAIIANDHDLTDVDVDRLSVHDTDRQVFLASGSDGTCGTLHRNGSSLGDPGSISIESDEDGVAPFEPDVPSEDEVGHDATAASRQEEEEDLGNEPQDPLFEDWTPRWESDAGDWGVVSGSAYRGDHALAFEHDGSERTRYAISWDGPGEPADVEVLDRFRVPSFTDDEDLGFHARVHLRSSTTDGREEGYWIEVEARRDCFRLGKYTDGDLTTLARFGTPTEDTFFHRRFRADGDRLRAKVWPAGESEPSEWDVEVTDGDHSAGWVGLGSYDTGLVETDVMSVGTDGEPAPAVAGGDESPSRDADESSDERSSRSQRSSGTERSSADGDDDAADESGSAGDESDEETTHRDGETPGERSGSDGDDDGATDDESASEDRNACAG